MDNTLKRDASTLEPVTQDCVLEGSQESTYLSASCPLPEKSLISDDYVRIFREGKELPILDFFQEGPLKVLSKLPQMDPKRIFMGNFFPIHLLVEMQMLWPAAKIHVIGEKSADIQRARKRYPFCHFIEGDINHWVPLDPYDLIFIQEGFHCMHRCREKLLHWIKRSVKGTVIALSTPTDLQPYADTFRKLAKKGVWSSVVEEHTTFPMDVPKADELKSLLAGKVQDYEVFEERFTLRLVGDHPLARLLYMLGIKKGLDSIHIAHATLLDRLVRSYQQALLMLYPHDPIEKSVEIPFSRLGAVIRV